MKNKKAFTLIELLVVVLIIGILTAIALPQYQKAVEKARWTEVFFTINNLKRQHQITWLENPETFTGWDETKDAIVDAFNGGEWTTEDTYTTKNFKYIYGGSIYSDVGEGFDVDIYRINAGKWNMEVDISITQYGLKIRSVDADDDEQYKFICPLLKNTYGEEVSVQGNTCASYL